MMLVSVRLSKYTYFYIEKDEWSFHVTAYRAVEPAPTAGSAPMSSVDVGGWVAMVR